jgi:hypothetical protein
MNVNPINQTPVISRSLPVMDFQVTLILGSDEYADIYIKVKEICEVRAIKFSTREFDSAKYEHDAIMISSLPCFYISKRKSSQPYSLFYPDKVLEGIKTEFLRCKSEIEEKERKVEERKQAWNQTFLWMKNFGKQKSSVITHKS